MTKIKFGRNSYNKISKNDISITLFPTVDFAYVKNEDGVGFGFGIYWLLHELDISFIKGEK